MGAVMRIFLLVCICCLGLVVAANAAKFVVKGGKIAVRGPFKIR
jgi:hypothetical protein